MCDVSNFETKPGYSKNTDNSRFTKDSLNYKNHHKYLKHKKVIKKTPEKEFVCPQCRTNFKDFQSIVNHTCKPFRCTLCSEEFLHDFQLRWHDCCTESTEETEAEEFICDSCESSFETPELLSQHKICCYRNLGGVCVSCNKKLSSNFHEVCEDCKLKFNRNQQHKLLSNINKQELQSVPSPETIEVSQNDCSDQPLEHPIMNTRRRVNGIFVQKRTRKNDLEQLLEAQVQFKESDVAKKSDKESDDKKLYINESSLRNPDSLPDRKIHFSGKFKASKKQPSATSSAKVSTYDSTSLPRVLLPKIKECNASEGKDKKANKESLQEEEGSHDQPASGEKSDSCLSESSNMSTRRKETNAEAKSTSYKPLEMKDISLIEVTVSGNHKKSRIVNLQRKKEDISDNNSSDPKAKEIFSKSTFSQKIAKLNDVSDDHSSAPTAKAVKRKTADDASKISVKKKKKEQYSKNSIPDTNLGHIQKTAKRKTADSINEYSLESKKIEKPSSKDSSIKANSLKSSLVSSTSQNNHQKEKKKKSVTFCKKTFYFDNKKRTHSFGNNSISVKNKSNAKEKQELHPPIESFCNTSHQRTGNGMYFNGFRVNSENQKKKQHAYDRNKNQVIHKNIPRLELEVTKSTLSAIPDDIKKTSYPKSNMFWKTEMKYAGNKYAIELEIFRKALPPKSSFLLKVFNSNMTSFRCSKCPKLFDKIKSGALHYSSCNSRFKKKMLINLNEVVIFCTSCPFHCSVLKEMVSHKERCSLADSNKHLMNYDYFRHYEDASKNFICDKCGYSCLSFLTFNQHPCEKRLHHMQKCTVAVRKLTPTVLNTHHLVTKFECSFCKAKFYDDVTFKKHAEIHLSDGVKVAKVFIDNGKTLVIKQIKKLLKENQNCETTEDLMEKVVKPIAKLMESVSNTENLLPELNLDLILPGAIRKLVEDLCLKSFSSKVRRVLSDNVQFLNVRNLFGDDDDEEDGDSKKTDQTHRISNANASSIWESYKCNCEKESPKPDEPNQEEKPCLKCLHKFMNDYSLSESQPDASSEETMEVQNNEPKSNTNEDTDVSNFLVSMMSSSNPSSIVYTPPSCDSVSGPDYTTATCTASDINSSVGGLFSVSEQPNSFLASTCDSSSTASANDITSLDEYKSMEMMSSYYSNNYSTDLTCAAEFNGSGVYLNEKEVNPNEINTDHSVTTSNVIPVSVSELSEMLHSNSCDISNSLSLDLPPKDNNIDDLYGDQNYQHPQSITLDHPFPFKDVNIPPFMDSSSNEGKTPYFPTSRSPGLEQVIAGFSPPLTPADDSIKLNTCVRDNANDCSYETPLFFDPVKVPESSNSGVVTFENCVYEVLHSKDADDNNESMEFNIDNVHVSVQFTFNASVTYSAYVLREGQHFKYVCASCISQYSLRDLAQHLIKEHKEKEIKICVS